MRILVHGGMQKTGSTSIQAYLNAAISRLRDAEVYYPDFGEDASWLLSAAFARTPGSYHQARRHRGPDIMATAGALRESLRSRAAEPGSDGALLLSHEDLSVALTAARVFEFFDEASGDAQATRMVAYVRHPTSHYPSAVQQAMKSNRDRAFLPDGWLSPHVQRALKLAGQNDRRVILRPFAPPGAPGWDVVEDFRAVAAASFGRELPSNEARPEANTSYSAEACALLAARHETGLGQQIARVVPRLCRLFEAKRKGTKLRVPPEWETDIAAVNADGWNRTVALLDCGEETRESLRIVARPSGRTYTDRDVQAWLLSNLDREWCEDLMRFSTEARLPGKVGQKIARWIARDVLVLATRSAGAAG